MSLAGSLCSQKREADPGHNDYSTITDLSAVASAQAGHFNGSPASAKATAWQARLYRGVATRQLSAINYQPSAIGFPTVTGEKPESDEISMWE